MSFKNLEKNMTEWHIRYKKKFIHKNQLVKYINIIADVANCQIPDNIWEDARVTLRLFNACSYETFKDFAPVLCLHFFFLRVN